MRGVFTAVVTPFDGSGQLDLTSFKRIIDDQKKAKVSGIVVCGTTGESPTLSTEEKKLLISTAIKELKGSGVQVIAGTGSNNTATSLELSRWASEQGANGVLIVTPYYNKPSQAGLENHFRSIADAVKCEVIAYNVPGRTGVSLTADTVAKLADHPRITTLKEATGNVAFTSEILDALNLKGRSMDILSGDDATYLPLLSIGAAGVISVASNLFPRAMVAIQNAMDTGASAEALRVHKRFYPLFRDLFVESNPVPIKAAMAYAGWCGESVRPPLAPLSSNSRNKLEESLRRCGIEKGKAL